MLDKDWIESARTDACDGKKFHPAEVLDLIHHAEELERLARQRIVDLAAGLRVALVRWAPIDEDSAKRLLGLAEEALDSPLAQIAQILPADPAAADDAVLRTAVANEPGQRNPPRRR